MAALVDAPPSSFVSTHQTAWTTLGVQTASFTPGLLHQSGSTATEPLTTELTLGAFGPLRLTSTLTLHKVSGHWRVLWTPQTIDSRFGAGDRFSVKRTWPTRAPVLGTGGASLTPGDAYVTVGLDGAAIKDPSAVRTGLVKAGLDAAKVDAALAQAAAHPTLFEPVQTLTQAAYQQIKPQIYPLIGVHFQHLSGPLTPDLAAHVVGTTAPITAEQLKALGAPYAATDTVGQGGIEETFERQLAGTPGASIVIVDSAGHPVVAVGTHAPTPGTPVQTSIDPTVQRAAEAALDGVAQPAALVVMRASTGQVLGSVSRPTGRAFDLALNAAVPPGSSFKVVTTGALLAAGDNASTTVACPPTLVVDGKSFHNFEQESAATMTLPQAFAQSCNTAFIGLASKLPAAALVQAASTFGLLSTPKMGLSAFGGRVPQPATPVDQAAEAFGQGQIVVSPLAMAAVAAAVDSGSVHPPRLVTGAPDDTAAPRALDPGVVSQLRTFMAAVVTSGTAAGAGLPAGTAGKTGTAEFGSGPNPATHAWFIGFRGDLAFSVFVYGGGVGGQVAAPIAAKLLKALPAG
jgi:cell division protein FtsI/penicillin-binding protein 2